MKQITPIHTLEVQYLLEVLKEHGIDVTAADPRAMPFIRSLQGVELLTPEKIHRRLTRWLSYAGDKAWGLQAGAHVKVSDMGAFGHALISSRNLRSALKMVISYRGLLRTAQEVSSGMENGLFRYSLDALAFEGPTAQFFTEAWLANLQKTLEMLLGPDRKFHSVCLSYPRPPSASTYEDFFDCPVQFGEVKSCFKIPADYLDLPFTLQNEDVQMFCEKQCRSMLKNISFGEEFVNRARELLLKNPGWFPSCEELAGAMHISSRTLRRKLNAEGSSYREILESVRKELALNYLKSTDLSVEMIAYRIGYEDPNSFYKAFKRWYDKTPRAFIENLQ